MERNSVSSKHFVGFVVFRFQHRLALYRILLICKLLSPKRLFSALANCMLTVSVNVVQNIGIFFYKFSFKIIFLVGSTINLVCIIEKVSECITKLR